MFEAPSIELGSKLKFNCCSHFQYFLLLKYLIFLNGSIDFELNDPKSEKYRDFTDYFNDFYNFCFELPLDNMLRETVNFKKRYGST